jgi:hypothetical protein
MSRMLIQFSACCFKLELRPKFEDEYLSEKVSAETKFRKIDP